MGLFDPVLLTFLISWGKQRPEQKQVQPARRFHLREVKEITYSEKQSIILTPLSSRLTNSSLILRSCRPYFLAAHRDGGAELDRPLNGNPSVGVPTSSSPLASSSSSLEIVEATDSEFSLTRPFAVSET